MDAQTVLVVVLAVALAIFLTLAIVLTVMLIRVAKQVRHITDQAEKATANFISVSKLFKKSVSPAAVSTLLAQLYKKLLGPSPKAKKKRK